MSRSARLAVLAGAALILVAGSALATQSPKSSPPGTVSASQEPEAPPSAADVTHAVDRLRAHGMDVSAARLRDLAADFGLGGAVRLIGWSDDTGMSVAELQRMREGHGWGQMAHDLGVHPGLGSIMGGGQGPKTTGGPD
jgi:hypothetical protein